MIIFIFLKILFTELKTLEKKNLFFIEIQLGKDIKEDDIVRIEDDYGKNL